MKKIIVLLIAVLALLCSCDPNPEDFNSDSVMYNHMVEVWRESLEPYSTDIAFFGDSRVIGADWVSAYPESSVVNLGIGGDKVEDLLKRLCLLDALEIKKCFVAIGGNNALSSHFNASSFREKYELLIDELQEREIEIFLNTVAPISNFGNNKKEKEVKSKNQNINTVNSIIKELATQKSVTLLDIASLMTDSEGKLKREYTTEGIHFSQEGNNLWYDFIRPYLNLNEN